MYLLHRNNIPKEKDPIKSVSQNSIDGKKPFKDDDDDSLDDYGEDIKFNEDGSFIGQYGEDKKTQELTQV